MATEFSPEGYTDLRKYIMQTWTYIGLREGSTEHLRLPLSDDRVTVIADGSTNPGTIQVELAGDDEDIDVDENGPLTVDNTALYKVPEGGDILSQASITPVTLGSANDTATIRHHVQVPEITE